MQTSLSNFPKFVVFLGFWVCDKAGKMRQLKSGIHPILDGCCFPLLHPRATLGWRFFMKKANVNRRTSKEEEQMQTSLEDIRDQELMEQPSDAQFEDENVEEGIANENVDENAVIDEDTAAEALNKEQYVENEYNSNHDVFVFYSFYTIPSVFPIGSSNK